MNLWEIVFHPEREEQSARGEIIDAANQLETGEFQVLQLAYLENFGRPMEEARAREYFQSYILANKVPWWARAYARRILELARENRLDMSDPHYHQFDSECYRESGQKHHAFWPLVGMAVLILIFILWLTGITTYEGASLLPPCCGAESIDRNPDDRMRAS